MHTSKHSNVRFLVAPLGGGMRWCTISIHLDSVCTPGGRCWCPSSILPVSSIISLSEDVWCRWGQCGRGDRSEAFGICDNYDCYSRCLTNWAAWAFPMTNVIRNFSNDNLIQFRLVTSIATGTARTRVKYCSTKRQSTDDGAVSVLLDTSRLL